jgi:putative ABC transport system permease protein
MRLTGWAKLARRDLLGSPRGSLCLVAVIGLSVMANTAIRATSDDFVRTLGNIERAGIAGDLSIELHESPQPSQLEALRRLGSQWTLVTSTMLPVRSDQTADPVPAVIKAVDPRLYPFYGELQLIPAQPLSRAIAGTSAVVSPELLHQLGLTVGDKFTINGVACHITAVIDHEPDRFAGTFSAPLRVIVSDDTFEQTGILRSSVPVLFRFAIAVPDSGNLAHMRMRLGQIFQGANVFGTSDSASPEIDAAELVSEFLFVIGWFALALAAGGVVVATHLHVQSRLETLGLLKCLGTSIRGAFFWLAIELLLLGAAGGMAGCCAGLLARRPLLELAHIETPSTVHGSALLVFEAILIGIALPEILGFAWLLPVVRQRPAALLRNETAYASSLASVPVRSFVAWLVFCGAAVLLIGEGWISVVPVVGALAAAMLLLHSLFQTGFRLVQRAIARASLGRLPLSVRQGARNFLRIGSSNGITTGIAAFVVVLSTIAALGQTIVVREVARSLPMSQANLYLMGFSHAQLAGIRSILDRHPDIQKPYDIRTFVWFRLGAGASAHALPGSSLLLPPTMVACSTELPAGSGIVLDTSVARRFGVHPGSTLNLFQNEIGSRDAIVGSVREMAPTDRAWSSIAIPCAGLDDRVMFHHAGLKLPEHEIPALVRELNASYPALAVVRPAEIFAEVANVVRTGAAVVEFISLLTIATGLVVAGALMAASARQRSTEIAILRALGASRFFILRMMVWEFGAMGSVAGLLGGVAGIFFMDAVLSLALEKRILEPHLVALGSAMLAGIIVGVAAGWLACVRVFRQRPLLLLRQN